ncbi:MAG: PQQ-binding-like beta-propeller repeat protein, partial [Phycisphaerae bacterium]
MAEHTVRWRPAACLAVLAAFTWSPAVPGAEIDSAGRLVQDSGVKGGLVVHVGCGSAEWTAALRVNQRYVVQGLEPDAASVAEAAKRLRDRRLPGPVTVIRWDGKRPEGTSVGRLPYADNLVNLMIVDSPKDLPADEIMRVLAPRGIAYVRSNGGWKKHAKPWPDTIDEWTHFLHGPDNNAVAEDTRVAPPRHLQWVAGPRWARSHDHLASVSAAVTAAGRLFYMVDEGPIASVKAPSKWMLVARDAFSGVLLWKKEVSPWENQLRPFRSGPAELPRRLVAVGQRVYATLGYGKPVTALDAATGEVVRTYEGTENTHEIVADGGNLHLVVSAPLEEDSPTTGKVLRRFDVWRGAYDEYVVQYMPRHIRVVNAETGRLVWKKQDREVRNILPLTLIAGGGRVFFENPDRVVALKAGSGEVLWRADRPAIRHRYAWLTPTLVVKDGVVLSADRSPDKPVDTGGEDKTKLEWRVSANHILTGGEIMAFSAESGEKLWTAPCHEGFNSPVDVFVVGGKVWSGELAWGKQPGTTKLYDLHTGKVVATRSDDQKMYTLGFGHHRCHRNKATTKYVIHSRAGVEFFDVSADRVVADHWVRGGCQYGILPANGLLYAPSHPCACYITAKLSGFNALSAERATPFSPQPARLEKGPAYGKLGNPQSAIRNPQLGDWPTYRHDAARSGAASAALSGGLTPHWAKALPGPLTAVVVADGRLYVAQREAHTLHALRAEDGSPLWCYTAGGRVDSPPTVYRGLVYFGSADGWVYCLRAEDGALAWRFRVAPEPRQIVSYGQLESVWPVHGNVLVCPGPEGPEQPVAYAAAGRSSFVDGGVYLCGVHAVTGELLVKRRISHRDPKTGLEPQDVIRGVQMPGAMPDVLATDGTSLFMRHSRMDLKGNSLPEDVDHLFSSAGYLDDTWWHRTYWQVGTVMRGGYGGWGAAGNTRISGRLLVRGGGRVFGFGRKAYAITGSHLGLQSEYHLFAADAKLITPAGAEKQKAKRRRAATKVNYHWSKAIPFYPRAMLLAGDTLFVAGPDDVGDIFSPRPEKAVRLWAVSTADGGNLAEYRLTASPVLDSFAAT